MRDVITFYHNDESDVFAAANVAWCDRDGGERVGTRFMVVDTNIAGEAHPRRSR